MAEQVQTGGVMQFKYQGQKTAELDPERKSGIAQGYADFEVRKSNEKRNKMIMWIAVLLLVIAVSAYFVFK